MIDLLLVNLMMILLSGLVMIVGIYGVMGLCCKGNTISKLFGGFLGFVGLSTFVLTVVPSCY